MCWRRGDEQVYRMPCKQSGVLGLWVLFAVLWLGGEEGSSVYITGQSSLLTGRFLFLLSINISRYRNSLGIECFMVFQTDC